MPMVQNLNHCELLFFCSGENLVPEKWYPPLRQPCPKGTHGACDASARPVRDTPDKNFFHKTEIKAAAPAAQTGAAAGILMEVWGQSALIITSNDFPGKNV